MLRPSLTGAEFSETTVSDSLAASIAAESETTGAGSMAGAGAGADFFAAFFGAGFSGSGVATAKESSIVATTSPIFTSAPATALIRKMPAASAVISVETLSVSSVSRASPLLTASPSFFSHAEIMPLVTDSPTAGIFTSRLIRRHVRHESALCATAKLAQVSK